MLHVLFVVEQSHSKTAGISNPKMTTMLSATSALQALPSGSNFWMYAMDCHHANTLHGQGLESILQVVSFLLSKAIFQTLGFVMLQV